jgi:Fe2+ transport system protein FeoA
MPDLVPVTVLRRGDVAEVGQLIGAPDQVRRLEELGLREGTCLEVLTSGAPCIVRLEGGCSKLCFREDDSLRVLVRARKSA